MYNAHIYIYKTQIVYLDETDQNREILKFFYTFQYCLTIPLRPLSRIYLNCIRVIVNRQKHTSSPSEFLHAIIWPIRQICSTHSLPSQSLKSQTLFQVPTFVRKSLTHNLFWIFSNSCFQLTVTSCKNAIFFDQLSSLQYTYLLFEFKNNCTWAQIQFQFPNHWTFAISKSTN